MPDRADDGLRQGPASSAEQRAPLSYITHILPRMGSQDQGSTADADTASRSHANERGQTGSAGFPEGRRASTSVFASSGSEMDSHGPPGLRHRNSSSLLGGGRRLMRYDTSGLFNESSMRDRQGTMGANAQIYDEPLDEAAGSEGLQRRRSLAAEALASPQVRSMRLIGPRNERYKWEQYFKTKEELAKMKKPLRQYYERNNYLISRYLYIDRLLESSLPEQLLQEYGTPQVPATIDEERQSSPSSSGKETSSSRRASLEQPPRMKRTAQNIYKFPGESTPLLAGAAASADPGAARKARDLEASIEGSSAAESSGRIVRVAIAVNALANALLLAAKIVVTAMSSSLSVLASLVDAALDFLSTAIVWATARLMARADGTAYPVGRRPLEPLGVLVFAVVMMTAFVQVGITCIEKLVSAPPHELVALDLASTLIMLGTIVLKGLCWIWCRRISNTSVQALAQDALTDVIFNTFSLLFPLVGGVLGQWWLDPLGGLSLAALVVVLWSRTAAGHLRRLSGCAADPDARAVLLYLTMRFAARIQQITALRAWHAGDGVLVEVDVLLQEGMPLRDSHDLTESLQYVLESVPGVERAWVHADYRRGNLSGHVARDDEN